MNFFNSLLTNADTTSNVIVPNTIPVGEKESKENIKSTSVTLPTLPKTVTTKGRTASNAAEFQDIPSQITAVKNSPSAIGLKFDTFDDVEQYFKDVSEFDVL